MSEHFTGEQLADAVREAHRDNDTYDVDHYCTRLTNRIAELEQQLAEARKDSERLEWLEDVRGTCGYSPKPYGNHSFYAYPECMGDKYDAGDTLRQAIDNAMKEHAQNEH